MVFKTRHLGAFGGNPGHSIELTIEGYSSTMTEDITDLRGFVQQDLIVNLRNLAHELEEHNEKILEKIKYE